MMNNNSEDILIYSDSVDEYIDSWFNFEGIYKLDEPEEPKETTNNQQEQLPF